MVNYQHIAHSIVIAGLLFTNYASKAHAGESAWPQFRGPNASGLAAKGQDPPIEFGPGQSTVWKTAVPSGHSSPCIWGNRIFLTGYDKDKAELRVFCVDRVEGEILWSKVVPVEKIEKTHTLNTPASSTPATDGERVYVYFGSCGLVCYDVDGNQCWKVPLATVGSKYGHSTSPIIVGDLVILNRDVRPDGYVLAVDCASGETVWKHKWPQPRICYSTPIVWSGQLIFHRNTVVAALRPADGTSLWSIRAATTGTNTPVGSDDTLFVGMWYYFGEPEQRTELPDFQTLLKAHDEDGDMKISGTEFPDDLAIARRPELGDRDNVEDAHFYIKPLALRLFDRNKDGSIDETEYKGIVKWGQAVHGQKHGLTALRTESKDGAEAAQILWQEEDVATEVPSPLYYDGHVYMVRNGGVVFCTDAQSGKLLYRERLGAGGAYFSSPICASGRIYVASSHGTIVVFEAADEIKILARNKLGEDIFATPAVVDNKLYVRTTENMYAFGE